MGSLGCAPIHRDWRPYEKRVLGYRPTEGRPREDTEKGAVCQRRRLHVDLSPPGPRVW